jgi:hypothetical protein
MPHCFQSWNAVIPSGGVARAFGGAHFIPSTNTLKDTDMNTRNILAAAALTLLAATGAQAETYDGVLTVNTVASRSAVQGQAVAAARAGDTFGEGYAAGVQTVNTTADRSAVRGEAVVAAHNSLQTLNAKSYYRDQIPAEYKKARVSFTRQAAN